MSKWKNEIKQTKPVKFSNWQVVKEMLAYEFKDLALKFKNGGWKGAVIGAGAVGLGMGLTGCVTTEKPPVVQYQEVEINNIDSLSEIKNLLGNNFVLSEKVEDAVKAEFGEDAIITVASENEDGSGNILVVVDVDGVKVATTSLNILASDFNARTFASNTYTKEGDKLSYYQNQEPKEEDLQGKFTYEDALGNLTVVDLSNVDEKVLNAFEDLTLKDTGLRYDVSPNAEAIFSQLLGRIISEDITIFMPTIDYDYDSTSNQTKVTLAYNQGSDIIKTVLSFKGNLLSSGSFDIENAIQQFKEDSVTKTTKTEDYSEYADYIAIISNGNKGLVVKYIDDENGSEQGQEETITFNSWDEVFNVFGKENSQKVKDMINKILIEKLFNEENIKTLFGNDMTLEDLINKNEGSTISKIQILKWAFTLTNNDISSVQMLGIRNGYRNQFDKILQNATFELNESLSYKDISAKANVKNELTGQYILCVENGESSFIVVDFNQFAEKLRLSDNGTTWDTRKVYTPADEEGEKIFNLLMPYAVSEITTYNHIRVDISDIMDLITVKIYVLNENTHSYEEWKFSFNRKEDEISEEDEASEDDETSKYFEELYAMMGRLLKQGKYESSLKENKQMIFGDIIFNVGKGNENVIEISPYSQQSVSEKQ